jgi:hypothetical protein
MRRLIAAGSCSMLLGLLLVLARSASSAATGAPAASPAALRLGPSFAVKPPPAVAAVMAAMARRPAINRQVGRPAQQELVPLTDERFESTTFPPPNWELVDRLAATAGAPPRYVWDRETCDVDPLRGGQAAVWAVGGGQLGSQLPCASAYTAPVDSWLVYGPIDTRAFSGGLAVNLLVKLDQASASGGQMQLCATQGPTTNDVSCRAFNDQKTNWVTFTTPLVMEWAAGHAAAVFALRYVDATPPGNVFGALADNVVLQGVRGDLPPTATDTPAVPSATETLPPSATHTQRPPAIGRVYLPWLYGGAAKTGLGVQFGVDVDANKNLIQPGSVFQFGIPTLCARIQWLDQPPGTSLRWQWFKNGAIWDVPQLNGNLPNAPADGVQTPCVDYGTDENGNPNPVPIARYEVAVYLNGASQPDALGQAVVQADPPPGATAITTRVPPTEEPTQTAPATATVGATATSEPGTGCPELLTNGNFELGARDWSAFENGSAVAAGGIIVKGSNLTPSPPMVDGEWLALFGSKPSVEQQLHQTWANGGALIDPARLMSATLRLSFLVVSQETPNGNRDDWLAPFFVRPDGEYSQPERSVISEELIGTQIQEGNWYRAEIDVAEQMRKRPGWDTARLVLDSTHNAEHLTSYLVDRVSLSVCLSPGAAGAVTSKPGVSKWLPLRPRTPSSGEPGPSLKRMSAPVWRPARVAR